MTAYEALEKAIETNGLHMKLLKFKLVHAYSLQYANHDTQVLNQYFKNGRLPEQIVSYESKNCYVYEITYKYQIRHTAKGIVNDIRNFIIDAETELNKTLKSVFNLHLNEDINGDICKSIMYDSATNMFTIYSGSALAYEINEN